jgi:hypothetical protein
VSARLFVDETKAKGYVVVAAVAPASDLVKLRNQIRGLVLPGQFSLHMKDERDSRRRLIADTVVRMTPLGVTATIYDAGRRGPTELDRRGRIIAALVEDALKAHDRVEITFDLDETLRGFDRQRMIESTRGMSDRITYGHAHRNSEPLLAIPDALAWCWARGGDWRRRIGPVIREVRDDV